MRKMLALTGAAFGLVLSASFGVSAQADEVATRCGSYGCDRVDCHDQGNRCTRYSDYDSYYNGYTNGGYTNGYYGGNDSYAPYWDYHEYYRVHGYRWNH